MSKDQNVEIKVAGVIFTVTIEDAKRLVGSLVSYYKLPYDKAATMESRINHDSQE